MDKEALAFYLDQLLDKQKPTITGRISNSEPEIQYITADEKGIIVENIPPEDYYIKADFSEIEKRIYFNDIIDNRGYMPMFDMPSLFDLNYINDFIFKDPQSFPTPEQKWVRSRTKHHEPRSVFLAKAKRKRNLDKANRKRARNG